MAEQNREPQEESLLAPEKLVEALNRLQKERIFVPPALDHAVLREARKHLRRLKRPQSRWKSRLSWAAMAACLALAVWLGERFSTPTRARPFAREDINRDGRVDILDAFALSRRIETGGTLDPRWDINGDGRVDRADVDAIAARAVNLAEARPGQRRSADLSPQRAGTITVWRTEVRALFFGLPRSLWQRRHASALQWSLSSHPDPLPRGEGTFPMPDRTRRVGSVQTQQRTLPLSESEGLGERRQNVSLPAFAFVIGPRVNVPPASCRQTPLVRRSQHASEKREGHS